MFSGLNQLAAGQHAGEDRTRNALKTMQRAVLLCPGKTQWPGPLTRATTIFQTYSAKPSDCRCRHIHMLSVCLLISLSLPLFPLSHILYFFSLFLSLLSFLLPLDDLAAWAGVMAACYTENTACALSGSAPLRQGLERPLMAAIAEKG